MDIKLSVLKPQRLRNLCFFLSFFGHNFEDTVTNFEKEMFREESLTYKQNFQCSVFSDFFILLQSLQ